jgi:hypothetical protein
MPNTAQTSEKRKKPRAAIITVLSFIILAGCSGGGGSGASAGFNAPPTGGGGGTPGNNVPVITSSAPTSATEGQLYSYQATASDADGDPLSWALTTSPTGMTVNASGLVQWTPTTAQVGSHDVTLQVTDGIDNAQQSWTINVAAAGGGGGGGLPSGFTMTDLGALPNSQLVLSDMVEFDGKLYIAAAQAPLTSPFGAGVYYYDGTNIQTSFYDSGSQGFLRTKVYNNKLYIPDGDPNGYAPGKVYIWSTGSTTPLATDVTNAVHNFDVVEFNGDLYVSGSNLSGQSTLNKYNPATSTWDAASAGNYTRLKYLGVLDNKIWSSRTPSTGGADGVWIDSSMTQSGFNASSTGGNLFTGFEPIDGKLYTTLWGSAGVSKFIINPGSTTTAINGISGVMWDVIKHTDGNYYAVAWDGTNDLVYGSTDGVNFTELLNTPGDKFGQPAGSNADGRPSIASYNGKLYVGSSTNGHLYRLD